MACIGILLCGGSASRFGADKLLAGDEPIAVRAARNLLQGVAQVLAVLPPGRAELSRALEAAGCEILETDRTSLGIGSSLAAGIEASLGADGWIVALGDMPAIEPRTVLAVRQALEAGASIAAPYDAKGRRGHPVGFATTLRDELLALRGDAGAREILSRRSPSIARVATDDRGIFVDIDTPDDLRLFESGNG